MKELDILDALDSHGKEADGFAALMKAYTPYQLQWILSVSWPDVHGRPCQQYVAQAKATELEVVEAVSTLLRCQRWAYEGRADVARPVS